MKIVLLQPKYPHGGTGKHQSYLPGGLMNLGSRMLQAGIEVEFIDLKDGYWNNWRSILEECDFIGFTTMGPPFIAEVLRTLRDMREAGLMKLALIGGEGMTRLDPDHFQAWFGGYGAIQIRNDRDLASVGIVLPDAFSTSMVAMLKRLSDRQLRTYLTSEFALFMSQGCAFNCAFCAAAKAQKEQFRSCESLADEVEFICQYLQRIDHRVMSVYLTNLDAFQTPVKLEERLQVVRKICNQYGIVPHLRCLATTRCTFRACRADPELPKRLRECGLDNVGFGVDGADEETWARQNKKHNSMSELQGASKMLEQAGIAVELLMVIGFQDDNARSLWRDLKYSLGQAVRGRVIRPYLAKISPAGRWPEEDPQVEAFLKDPDLLPRLDYAMIGSRQSHPRRWHRLMVNATYLAICVSLTPFGKCPTRPLIPVPNNGIGKTIATAVNRLMPFDR